MRIPLLGRHSVTALALACAALGLAYWYTAEESYSNIHPADYVGPDACRECHEDNHQENFDLWKEHSHRVMNQNANEETVLGDFSGAEIEYGPGRAVFHRHGPHYLMSVYVGKRLVRRHKVTRTVGSLYVQYYIGRQIQGPEPRDHPTYRMESKLPFGYSIELERWLPEIYLDSTVEPERVFLTNQGDYIFRKPPTHNWNLTCLNCHNTYPYVARLWSFAEGSSHLWMGGFPRDAVDWQGSTQHRGELEVLPGLRALSARELVTLGISCESCHFGGREHAVEEKEIRFVPTAPKLTVRRPGSEEPVASDREDPFVVNSICAQCHNSELARHPNSAPAVNSNEANALRAGACSSQIKCTDCHNPHETSPPSGAPDEPGHIEACLGCHPQLEDPAAAARHTRHSPDVSCLDCHMPRIVAGLDTVTRSHYISLPSDRAMIANRKANACNLCHLDRPITWTLRELERGWGVEAPPASQVRAWYGPDRETPLGTVWLESEDHFTRLAATEAYARSSLVEDRIPFVLESLKDERAFNRTLGLIALRRLLGSDVPEEAYDLLAAPAERAEQVERLADSLREPGPLADSAAGRAVANPGS